MKNLLLIVAFVASAICASAQKVYFIYLQSDNSSPFYLKMNDKIYSSTVSGYLILPNLIDSTYNFSIGFPSSQSESRFTIKLVAKDRGFLIKNFESGLGLFDLQNLNVINEHKDGGPKNISFIRRNDDFSSLLSKAANDTSLLYAVVRTQPEEVTLSGPQPTEDSKLKADEPDPHKNSGGIVFTSNENISEIKRQDSAAITQQNFETKKEGDVTVTAANELIQKDSAAVAVVENTKNQQIVNSAAASPDSLTNRTEVQMIKTDSLETVFKRSQVKKHSESSTSEGFGLIYYDIHDGVQDTIRILIPNPPFTLKQVSDDSLEIQKDVVHLAESKDTVQRVPIVVSVKNSSPAKTQCKLVASENDFFKLRKNMAAENTDEAMVAQAKKVFKATCFTTEQIKNLGALFLTSSGKYQFFDAAYLHVTDQDNFSSLESEIKDDYYLKRFKALIGE